MSPICRVALALARLVADRGALDGDPFADQSGEVGQRAAELALERVADGLELLVVGALVDEQHDCARSPGAARCRG